MGYYGLYALSMYLAYQRGPIRLTECNYRTMSPTTVEPPSCDSHPRESLHTLKCKRAIGVILSEIMSYESKMACTCENKQGFMTAELKKTCTARVYRFKGPIALLKLN